MISLTVPNKRILFSTILLGFFSFLGPSILDVLNQSRPSERNNAITVRPVAWAKQQKKKKRPKVVAVRARKPDFSKASKETKRIYFDDILKEGLAGPLPALAGPGSKKLAGNSPQGTVTGPNPTSSVDSKSGPFTGLISPATVEGQVKRTVNELSKIITTPRKFRTDYQKAHIAFTKLAVLFGVNEVMVQDVRWHSQAGKLRVSLAKTAASCRVGTAQAFQAAKQSLEDMRTVLSGSRASLPDVKEPLTQWDSVADRGPLMAWLEDLHQNKLRPYASGENAMKKNQEQVKENAELVAAISKILILPELDDFDDEDYQTHSKEMLSGAREIVSGIDASDYSSAIKGVNRIEKSCTSCHEDYR